MTDKTLFILFSIILLGGSTNAQYANYGDAFSPALGLEIQSPEVAELIANYHLEKVNDTHYKSGEGLELLFKNGLLAEARFYKNSPVYGSFTGVLPHRLKFGMGSTEFRSLLGKPTVVYSSSGYMEFEKGSQIISCWVEEGKLSQVSISLK